MLSTSWERRPAVLVFLRYFGCPLCRRRVVSFRGDRERFEEVGAQVVLIAQGKPEDGRRFAEARTVAFPLLVDPTRAAYDAYGFVRGSVSQVFGPQCVIPMVRAAAKPESRQGLPNGGHLMQMPGTFVVDVDGVVRLAHRSAPRSPTTRPPPT
jgi:peroxiredoxin